MSELAKPTGWIVIGLRHDGNDEIRHLRRDCVSNPEAVALAMFTLGYETVTITWTETRKYTPDDVAELETQP